MTNKFAAKMLLVACLGLISACGLVFLPKAKATTILGNADPMSKSCATGYTRRLGNFCAKDGQVLDTNFTLDAVFGTCRSTAVSIPGASPTFILITIRGQVRSNNAVALRSTGLSLYNNNTCTGSSIKSWIFQAREFVAVAANNILVSDFFVTYPVPVVGGNIYYIGTNTSAGSNSTIGWGIVGYYD